MIKKVETGLSCSLFISDDSLTPLSDFIQQCIKAGRKLFLLCDENTQTYCLPVLKEKTASFDKVYCIQIPSGEKNKTIESCNSVWKELLENEADRNSVLINLGGGVICDLGGFAASCFKRGIDFVHIPTTLLAMTDAAIGGKNAINIGNYKNQMGSFTLPHSIFVYTPFLQTLNERNIKNGFAEMLKHGLIADKTLFKDLVAKENFTDLHSLEASITIKNKIVVSDLRETGLRKLLNFGHTIGHAIESHFQTKPGNELLHGEAIAAGMICESFISNQCAVLSKADMDEICAGILKFFPRINVGLSINELMPYLAADKKNVNGQFNFTLLDSMGIAKYDCFVFADTISDSLKFYNSI